MVGITRSKVICFLFFPYGFSRVGRLGADLSACRPQQRAEGAAGVEGTEPEGAAWRSLHCSTMLHRSSFSRWNSLNLQVTNENLPRLESLGSNWIPQVQGLFILFRFMSFMPKKLDFRFLQYHPDPEEITRAWRYMKIYEVKIWYDMIWSYMIWYEDPRHHLGWVDWVDWGRSKCCSRRRGLRLTVSLQTLRCCRPCSGSRSSRAVVSFRDYLNNVEHIDW